MLINRLLARRYRPERGWDPIPVDYARAYADAEYGGFDPGLVVDLERRIGPLAGRRVLDLGAGPGQYSIAFARAGADVVWHDVSRNYLSIARAAAEDAGVSVRFSLGYLEDAAKFSAQPFDLVFNRICWRYSFDDRAFADMLIRLVAPGGAGYVDSHHADDALRHGWSAAAIRYRINARLGIKIGHPPPPPGRITSLLRRNAVSSLSTDWSTEGNERVLFIKVR